MDNNYILKIEAFDSIIETYKKGEQSIVFINRRGWSRTLKCENCSFEAKCGNCNNFLSYHKNKNFLQCHYCNFKEYNINNCKNCGSKKLIPNKGIGVEQVEKEIINRAMEKNISLNTIIFSSDEITKEQDIDNISNEIKNGKVDVIIGTQILTKGHHFPRLTNIIILDIDGMNLDGDFRSFEKTFQMLFQLSGRAGREKNNSNVYIQTINPNNIVLQAIKNHDIKGFYKNEILQRKKFSLPPYSRFISIIVSSEDKTEAINFAEYLLNEIKKYISKNIEILGPAESTLNFLKKQHRYRFLLKTNKTANLQNQLNTLRQNIDIPKKIQLKFDVDPYSFL